MPSRLLIVGDLKFFAQLQGRDNMSGSSCMWCTSHPQDWKTHPLPQCDIWTVKRIKDRKQKIEAGILKEQSDIQGIVNLSLIPILPFRPNETVIYWVDADL